MMKIDTPEEATFGPYAGLVQLGVTADTEPVWTESMHHMLQCLEAHFDQNDYILGGAPTLADFALLGPLYPHLYKDPVPGFMMRSEYPLVSEWIERANGSREAGYGSYLEPSYELIDGELVLQPGKAILEDDEIPATLYPLLEVFFAEMWPMLKQNMATVTDYIATRASPGDELPGKSFYSPAQFRELQSAGGPLTYTFELRGVPVHKMASPYQVWMLQRLASAALPADDSDLAAFVGTFEGGVELLGLADRLAGCRVHKHFEKLVVAG